jgi:hypothetical protein
LEVLDVVDGRLRLLKPRRLLASSAT